MKATDYTTIAARPTTYAGVQMRSRLEAAYAQHVDNTGGCWEYEPECFADATGQYLPDFWMQPKATDPGGWMVEVKPHPILHNEAALTEALTRMEIIWTSHPGMGLLLVVGHDVPGSTEPKFWTCFDGRDRRWQVFSNDIWLPMIWDRPKPVSVPKLRPEGMRPEAMMQRLSLFIESHPGASTRSIETEVPGKASWIRLALSCLVAERYIEVEIGPRRQRLHRVLRPFRADAA